MTWQYRIICDDTGSLRIAEVYNSPPNTLRWTADPIAPIAEHPDELRADLTRMLHACDLPVLDEATLRETVASQTTKR